MAQRTLDECLAWTAELRNFKLFIVMQAIGWEWDAVTSFCEKVLVANEAAKRESRQIQTISLYAADAPGAKIRLPISGHHNVWPSAYLFGGAVA